MMRERDRASSWDEPTFWYLLTVEAARARRGGRPFLMLVADARGAESSGEGLTPLAAPDLVAALARCLRETDLVGWHRTGRTAGALLTQGDADPATARLVGSKVLAGLRAELPAQIRRALRVRIYRYDVAGERIGFDRVFMATGAGELMAPPGVTETLPKGTTESGGRTPPWLTERVVSRRAGT